MSGRRRNRQVRKAPDTGNGRPAASTLRGMHAEEQAPGFDEQQPDSPAPDSPAVPGTGEEGFDGLLGGIDKRPPSRFLFIVLLFVCILSAGFVYLAETENIDLVFNLPGAEPRPSERQKVEKALQRVMMLRAQGQIDEAYALLMSVHEKYPEEPNINRELGRHHLERGFYNFAQEYFELAAEKSPNNSKLNFSRGQLAAKRAEQLMKQSRDRSVPDRRKVELLDKAESFFTQAVGWFHKSAQGPGVYDARGARLAARRAGEQGFRCRVDKAAVSIRCATGVFGKDRDALRETLNELERLLDEPGLPSALAGRAKRLVDQVRKEF